MPAPDGQRVDHERMTSSLVLQLDSGDTIGGSDFVFRASEGYADDLTRALQQAGFGAEVPLSHAAGSRQGIEILVTLANAVGGIEGLAKALATFLARHEKKRIVLPDGTSLDGYGPSEVLKILEGLQKHSPSTSTLPGDR
jgi:hypothetical protein